MCVANGRFSAYQLVTQRGQLDIPAIQAVAAAVGDDVAGQPLIIFPNRSQEVSRATAVNTNNGLGRCFRRPVKWIITRRGHASHSTSHFASYVTNHAKHLGSRMSGYER